VNPFLYLIWTSGRNRFAFALRRVRSPRYGAALIVGAIYVWSFLLRPTSHPAAASLLLGQPTEMLITLFTVLMLMGTWVFGADSTALAFTPAELSILFPAPLSRRSLIGYKLFRSQIAVMINALIWVFVLRRGGTLLPSPLRAIGLWVLFSSLNLHRLGAALVRSSWREHGNAGARRHRLSLGVFTTIGLMLFAGLYSAREQLLAAHGIGGFMTMLGRTLATGPASWALYPFHLVVAPTFARSVPEWLTLIVPALFVMLVHVAWVLRTDSDFEDAAIEASAERSRRLDAMRARRSVSGVGAPRPATSSMHLAPVGHPAFAILWKNILCLRRTAQLRVFIGPTVMAIALGVATSGSGADGAEVVAACALALSAMLLLFGGRLIRNDLRHDMQHLSLLKTFPLPAGDIVLAEVASAALPMAALQMFLVVVAYVALLASVNDPLGADVRLALLVAAPFAITALNGALLTIQNGTAVLFPAWVRLGTSVSTGVEALGQNVLATTANLFTLALAMVLPLTLGWLAVRFVGQPSAAAIGAVVVLAAVILATETYAGMRLLGRALERAEPQAT
jgi:ABC-2 type transport system permease protein